MKTDIVIAGCGVAGLYCALNLPDDKKITIITKNEAPKSDSFLAQGGICVLRDEEDFQSFFDDTMKAGHYENNPESVEIMIRSSQDVIGDLVSYGVSFEKDGQAFHYTREGAHSKPRILFHEDETGKEITSHLLETARKRSNITLIENYTMVDLICSGNACFGIVGHDTSGLLPTQERLLICWKVLRPSCWIPERLPRICVSLKSMQLRSAAAITTGTT